MAHNKGVPGSCPSGHTWKSSTYEGLLCRCFFIIFICTKALLMKLSEKLRMLFLGMINIFSQLYLI